MSSRTLTLLMPALGPSESVRHWPVALMLAAGSGRLMQGRVDVRLARARCVAKAYAPAGARSFVGARD
ncbi:MAG: hypothetical protein CMLOHMNK_00849 [Steroidobacteraceae bacterium]|nr:hypothetical protein [Steroidobacteraceae bacterium]